MPSAEDDDLLHGRDATTDWTEVLTAGIDSAAGRTALDRVCRRYWRPVHYYARKRFGHKQADDLTQGFFAHLIESKALRKLERDKARFRSWLLTSVSNYAKNEHKAGKALKRGGDQRLVDYDTERAESDYLGQVQPALSPEQALDVGFAQQLVDEAQGKLRAWFLGYNEEARWEAYRPYLRKDGSRAEYDAIAERLGITWRSVENAIYQLRKRWPAYVKAELHDLRSEDAERELMELFERIA